MPKGKTSSKIFRNINDKNFKRFWIRENSIKRHDFKTQNLINIAKNYKETKDFKWCNYKVFWNLEKNLIKNDKKEIKN